MSAKIKIVPKEDWDVLKKYFIGSGNEGLILIKEDVFKELSGSTITAIQEMDGYAAGYDFGGEADVYIDVVNRADHMFIRDLEEELESKED